MDRKADAPILEVVSVESYLEVPGSPFGIRCVFAHDDDRVERGNPVRDRLERCDQDLGRLINELAFMCHGGTPSLFEWYF